MPERRLPHYCHAENCGKRVPPKMFMCSHHWFRLPKEKRDRIWATYVPGQERRMDPSPEYIEAAMDAVACIAELESA